MAMVEEYLGDGLYASFDGWQIVLRAQREGGDHWVALAPEVYRRLRAFAVNSYAKVTRQPSAE
jgi:hypothetical protein